jgi:hypothetical protein
MGWLHQRLLDVSRGPRHFSPHIGYMTGHSSLLQLLLHLAGGHDDGRFAYAYGGCRLKNFGNTSCATMLVRVLVILLPCLTS